MVGLLLPELADEVDDILASLSLELTAFLLDLFAQRVDELARDALLDAVGHTEKLENPGSRSRARGCARIVLEELNKGGLEVDVGQPPAPGSSSFCGSTSVSRIGGCERSPQSLSTWRSRPMSEWMFSPTSARGTGESLVENS